VLYAFVKRNCTIGYCQGFNYITAHLLRHLNDEEESFWALCNLLESILPINYYSLMIGVLVDEKVFSRMLKTFKPIFWHIVKKIELDSSLVSLQWFTCLFSYNLRSEISDEIWDHFFLNGPKILFKAALSIINLIESSFLKCTNFSISSYYPNRRCILCI